MPHNRRGLSSLKIIPGLLLAVLGAIMPAACGIRQLARGELEPPKVSLKGVTLSKPTPAGWPLSLSLLVDNPNSQALNLLGYDFDFRLEGRSVAQGASQEAVNLPPQGQVRVEVPIFVQLPALMPVLPSMLFSRQQKLCYQVAGGFRLASLLGGLRVPFQFQGELAPAEGLEQLRPFLR